MDKMMLKNEILVAYGAKPFTQTYRLMEELKVEKLISRDLRIGLKPNLVTAKPHTSGATTSPDVVAGIITYLKDRGIKNICILESSELGQSTQKAFDACGYTKLSSKYGVPLIDLKKDSHSKIKVDGNAFLVFDSILDIDFLINIPVLKAHSQTKLTCALKNMKGCIPDSEKRRFHREGLHKPIADLNRIVQCHLIIVDGMMGDLSFELGGNPVRMDRIFGGYDPVAVDSYAAELIGLSAGDIHYLKLAEEMGIGTAIFEVKDIIPPEAAAVFVDQKVQQKQKQPLDIVQESACSACYGNLLRALHRMKDKKCTGKNKLYIGQGFKEKSLQGIGIGQCTQGFDNYVTGCPPTASHIIHSLEEWL